MFSFHLSVVSPSIFKVIATQKQNAVGLGSSQLCLHLQVQIHNAGARETEEKNPNIYISRVHKPFRSSLCPCRLSDKKKKKNTHCYRQVSKSIMADNTLAHEKRYNTHTRSLRIELYHDKGRTWYMIEVCFFCPYQSEHTTS